MCRTRCAIPRSRRDGLTAPERRIDKRDTQCRAAAQADCSSRSLKCQVPGLVASTRTRVEEKNRDQQRQPDHRHHHFVHFALPQAETLPSLRRVKCLYPFSGSVLLTAPKESV